MTPFHLAFPVTDIEKTRAFYHGLLRCPVGREAERWIDFDFFGHQITAHLCESIDTPATNPVDGEAVPVSHFGAILDLSAWRELADRLEQAGIAFLIRPQVRFEGQAGEQATLFIRDPSGNALEFKAFADTGRIFTKQE